MKTRDTVWLGTLVLFAAYIWLRDQRWLATADDIVPILAGLPLFVWLRWPFRFAADSNARTPRSLLAAALLFASGVVIDSTLVLTLGWTVLLASWLSTRVVDGNDSTTRRLLVLPFFSFPWIANDFDQLGWWFRLSGAAAAESLLALANVGVAREGTFLCVNGFPLSVEAACSGLNGLQSLLIAGTMLAFVKLKDSRWFWPALLCLPLAAWTVNLLRIGSAALVAVAMEPDAAARWVGPLHSAAGWLALCAMLGVCWIAFGWIARFDFDPRKSIRRWARNMPWLELAIIAYASVRCRGLLDAWFTNPFDRLGWIAFAIWILPLALATSSAGTLVAGAGRRRPWFMTGGLLLILAGDVGELNVCQHAGLVLIGMGFALRTGRALWALSAVAWIPALGWVASRFALQPDAIAILRVAIAMAGFAWVLVARRAATRATNLLYVGRNEITP